MTVNAQQVKISGMVSDAQSGEKLIGAGIYTESRQYGAATNAYGFYSLSLPKGQEATLIISYVGYEKTSILFPAKKDTTISIELTPVELEEITITAERRPIISSVNEIQYISPGQLQLPSLKPDIDILDVIKQLPGVQPGLEGSVGFSVRGGNSDQNLVLMDNIPLYNTGHLANFVSIFDPYAINSMTFYKGGFPAEYGGRISSVLDIYLKEGDKQRFRGEANIGLYSGKIALEGPIIKDRTSLLVSFRRSTVDLFLAGLYALTELDNRFMYAFHDLNIKVNHRVNEKNHLYVSVYHGGDRLNTTGSRSFIVGDTITRSYSNRYYNRWGNRSLSLRWNHIFSNSVFYNATLAYSGFQYIIDSKDEILDNDQINTLNKYTYGVSVNDIVMKHDLDVNLAGNNKIKTGTQLIIHQFEPVKWEQERIEFGGLTGNTSRNFVSMDAWELFGYIQGDFTFLTDRLSVHPGIRAGRYFLGGKAGFNLIEPRLRILWNINDYSNYQISYARMGQTVHSLNSSGTSLTADVWVPVTERLRPAISDEVSLAWNTLFSKAGIELQTGIYYKEMRDLIDFNGNSGFATISGQWDEAIAAHGFGRAYGFELMAHKKFEKFSVEGNYTLSRSVRKFEYINQGRFYPQNFDRPHNLTVSSVVKLNKKTTLSALWTYHTGQPISLGVQTFSAINNHFFYETYFTAHNTRLTNPNITNFENPLIVDDVNNFRMPDYHRLDISLAHSKMWRNGWKRTFGVSLYNTYNRQNAYFIYAERSDSELRFYKFTLFPILPTISYGVKF